MGQITTSRRRLLHGTGRLMTLAHPQGDTVNVMGFAPPPQSAQLKDGVEKAPFVCQITADETSAAGFTPRAGDWLTDGGKKWTLTDAQPVYDGPAVCGWTLIAAGGR